MRTVTFSSVEVARALRNDFICTWVNREPGFHNCDNQQESHIIKLDSFATKNFVTFFTSPDLDVLHYASGFFRPEAFLGELRFVEKLKGAVLDLKNRYMEDALPEFRELHVGHAEMHDDHRNARHENRAGAKTPETHHRDEGLWHLAAVHKDLVARAEKNQGPVPLDSVWKDYLFGNRFQETKSDSQGSKRSPARRDPPWMEYRGP